ncbi:hypothetical protein SPICUR_05710 [Spiribacter curvatus]|uniref:Biopolymer transporter ExbD n=1 Tax=Spiribacter curvatus TaxID=1335757 RepID=U5T3X5_9GAMM|nr:biopolymer transporter ExbD [Spiribacter curvatus]AGY92115.1 hypothetical protein SPICUR_05710 [Spiribacter curvatus]
MIGLTPDKALPRSDSETGLLPLINVVFLLLAFFLITAQLTQTAPFPVAPPTLDGEPLADQPATVIHVAADGTIAVESQPVILDALGTAIAEHGSANTQPLRLIADARADATRVITLLERLREEGRERVHLTTREP